MSDSPTVVFLPGNMCDHRVWGELATAFPGWKVEYHLPVESSLPDMARACLDRIPGKLIPIGFSMGAVMALAMADIAPERIAAIGLIDTNAGADRPERAHVRPRQQREVLENGLAKIVMEELKPAYFAAENRNDKTLRALVLDMALELGPEIFVSQSEALRTRPDYRHVVGSLDVPAFIACGEEDDLCPPDLHRQLAASTSNGELHVVPEAGHMLPLEQPEILSELLSMWRTRLEKELPCLTAS